MLSPLARSVAAALLSLAMAQPLAAQELRQGPGAAPDPRQREGQGLALGLMALAAVGILLHERREDREEEREQAERRLPSRCLLVWPTREGEVTLYDPDCLEGSFAAAARLPLGCAVTVRSRGRFVSGFSPACLREEGWRTRD